jgi:hypothetical protein
MKRKRAPGGGRKPKGEFSQLSSTLTIRIPDDMRKQLEDEAAAKGESMAQRLLWHLRQSFNRQHDRDRDPALHALLYMIGYLAENISLDSPTPPSRTYWRTDWYAFVAFKSAVVMLLDVLEEPPEPPPDVHKRFKEMSKQAEERGGYFPDNAYSLGHREFDLLLDRARWTNPLSEAEREYNRLFPAREHDSYSLPKAWKALELPESTTRSEEQNPMTKHSYSSGFKQSVSRYRRRKN